MKNSVLFLAFAIFGASSLKAQLNVGSTSAADASAILQATSTTKGFLPPVLTTTQRNAIVTPAPGLLIFNSTTNQQEVNSGTTTTPVWGANTAATFYNADGTLATNRVVSQGANTLSYLGTGGILLKSGAVNFDSSALIGKGDSLSGGVVGVGVTAQGGLNIGQNTVGNNLYIGYKSGKVTTGANNQFIGYNAGINTSTGYRNVFSGYNSGYANIGGRNNTFSGYQSGYNNTTGDWNTFIGINSGSINTTGYWNTAIGTNSGPTSSNLINTTSIGLNAQATVSNTVILGNGANVGIGTTTPTHTLELNGSMGITVANQLEFGSGVTKEVNAGKIFYDSTYGVYVIGAGTTSNNRKLQLYDNVVIPNGSLGIGTSTPSQALQVNGVVRIGPDNSGSVQINPGGGNSGFVGFYQGNGTTRLGYLGASASNMYYSAEGSAINQFSGNVGFNTSTAAHNFELNGSMGITAANQLEFGSGVTKEVNAGKIWYTTANELLIVGGGTANGSRKIVLADNVTIGGTLTVSGTNVPSDARLKKDIKTANYGLAEIMKMRPVTYSYKSNAIKGTQLGFLAQELEKLIPLVVNKPETEKDFYSVNYTELIPVLTKAIQEQQAQNDTQVAISKAQAAEIASLKKENLSIAAQLADMKDLKIAMAAMQTELTKIAVTTKVAASNIASK